MLVRILPRAIPLGKKNLYEGYRKWIESDNIDEIKIFIDQISQKSVYRLTLSEIISIFEEIIGDPNDINPVISYSSGLHPILDKSVDLWKEKLINKRDYKLNIING